jgi:hypothetical protein
MDFRDENNRFLPLCRGYKQNEMVLAVFFQKRKHFSIRDRETKRNGTIFKEIKLKRKNVLRIHKKTFYS